MINYKASFLPSPENLFSYKSAIKKFPVLEPEHETSLAIKFLNDNDINAFETLVTSHLRLVTKIAEKYKGYGLPLSEMISEGNLGLIQGIKKFDPSLGFRLSTYAIWWINAAIKQYILHSWSLVKIGTTAGQKKLFFSLNKIKKNLDIANDDTLSYSEASKISIATHINQKEIFSMHSRLSNPDYSLNSSLSSDNNNELIDLIQDQKDNHETVLGNLEEKKTKRFLFLNAYKNLNNRERQIIKERWLRTKASTLNDLSLKFGVSKERIRQIEVKALEKLSNKVRNDVKEFNIVF